MVETQHRSDLHHVNNLQNEVGGFAKPFGTEVAMSRAPNFSWPCLRMSVPSRVWRGVFDAASERAEHESITR